ncbi:glycosyl hydrolase catalytic core-domain-containing protein [Xylariaceae sp. FL0594]|nr:glycosyl hydrolase catalytic core-domain-containing protein [Xylariaceae sp. FL0594]
MLTKTNLLALCAAAAVKEVTAGHAHERLHAADKREIVYASTKTVYLTDYVTVTVTEGLKPTAAAVAPTIKAHDHKSTTTVPNVPVANPSPVSPQTTLVTAVKPAATKAAVAAPAPSAHGSSTKRGLAYNDLSLVQKYLGLGGQAGWMYNWDSSAWGSVPAGLTYYPMLWSPAGLHSNTWKQNAENAINNGADALLSFNEPDIATQASLSPQDAASGHQQWMNPFAGRARIGSPAVSSSANANQGIDWLRQFFQACNGQCKVDFCVTHWYGPGGDTGAQLFLSHLVDVHNSCDGKPVWVTEFAALDGDKDQFMRTIVSALESNDQYSFVERYSYYYAAVGELFEDVTRLSSFGKIFAGLSS